MGQLLGCPKLARNYFVAVLTKLVSIGSSRGIRIPKAIREYCGFGEEVELQVKKTNKPLPMKSSFLSVNR